MRNFSQQIFEERYGRPALAEWHLQWHDDVRNLATPDPKTRKSQYPDILEMQGEGKGLICCPEDQICMRSCQNDKKLCLQCRIPICADCRYCLTKNQLSPTGWVNDNFVGYFDPWIYEHDITWMEKTVATPFWTGMILFSIDRRASAQCPSESGERAVPVLHFVVANWCEPHPAVQKRLHTPRLLHDTSPSGRWSRFPGRAEEAQAL